MQGGLQRLMKLILLMNNMKNKIIPAILPKDFFDLKEHLERVKGVTNYVQIDICNSTYTPSKTWPFTHTPDIYFDKMVLQEEGMPFWEDIDFELDLMIKNPEDHYNNFLQLGPSKIIFHFETIKKPLEFIQKVKDDGMVEVGIAFSNNTRAIENKDVIELADFVQCMGIDKIGFQGQDFDERVLDQVAEIRALFPQKIISVDGSVNEDTIEDLKEVGVNHFVTGSAFFEKGNLVETLAEFEDLIK
jgi:ribulose-phosphate 3-epimerase